MPVGPFDSFDDCLQTMTEEEGHDEDSARNICGALEAEGKSEHGDPEGLLQAINEGSGLIADVGVDLVSAVDVPAVDSEWVMFKSESEDHDYQVSSPILLDKQESDTDKRIAYAAAMVPREPDKEGDVAPTASVEKAAHEFLKGDGGHDTDHSLIDGEGQTVESWILKESRTFDVPDGGQKEYDEGTWMLGVEWGADAWDRIQAGELTGLSIYGMAEHVPLSRAAKCVECGDALTAAKSQNGDTHKGDGRDSTGMGDDQSDDDGPDVAAVAASVDDLADTVTTVSDDLATLKEAVETDKQDEQELAAELGDVYDLPPGDVLDILNAAADHDANEVLSAIDSLSEQEPIEEDTDDAAKEDDEEDDEDDDEMEESVDKRADDANLGKGGDATGTASKGVHDEGGSGSLSYRALAEGQESD